MAAQPVPYDAPAIRAYAIALGIWREHANFTKAQLAEALGYTPQLISQIEAAKNIPSKTFSEDVDTLLKTGGLFLSLWKLINDTRHLITLPSGPSKYVQLESSADKIYVFEALLIPELLQSEAYARAIEGSLAMPVAEDAAQGWKHRKEIFSRKNPPRMFFVIDEWALRRIVGSPGIVQEQLARLLELSERPGTNIQVLPCDTEHCAALSGSFSILAFDNHPDVAYIQAAGQGSLITRPPSVAECTTRYELLRGHAYSVAESRCAIRNAMGSLKGP